MRAVGLRDAWQRMVPPDDHTTAAGGPAAETRDATYSIGDPALAEFLGLAGRSFAGVEVTESSSLGLPAAYRAVALIAGTIAGLPLKTYRELPDGSRERVASFLDEPHGPGGDLTPYEWKELVMVHLLVHGNAYLQHVYNRAGALAGLHPIHPSAVEVKPVRTDSERERFGEWRKYFVVTTWNGDKVEFTPFDMTHVPALGVDGYQGLAPLEVHRQAIGTGLAGVEAAARMFGSGMLLGGLVSGDEGMTREDAEAALAQLKAKVAGAKHAGELAFINAQLKFTPWTMDAEAGQFVQSRVHQVEELARVWGVPPHLLGQTEKATSWGTGITEQNRGLSRFTLMGWSTRLEERLSRLLPSPRFAEFDYSGLLQPAPEQEIPLLIAQVQAGLLTVDEARRIRNLGPLPAGAGPSSEVPSPAPAEETAP
jgi:HK97 family phage portal protein